MGTLVSQYHQDKSFMGVGELTIRSNLPLPPLRELPAAGLKRYLPQKAPLLARAASTNESEHRKSSPPSSGEHE